MPEKLRKIPAEIEEEKLEKSEKGEPFDEGRMSLRARAINFVYAEIRKQLLKLFLGGGDPVEIREKIQLFLNEQQIGARIERAMEELSQNPKMHGMSDAMAPLTKEEVDEIIANLEKKGVKIFKKPEEVFWGGYSSYVADPDDNLWEIAFNPYLALDEDGNTNEL